eukprot:SAG11_NODE_469_length_9207_cov_5.391744_10_plen_76_part_00
MAITRAHVAYVPLTTAWCFTNLATASPETSIALINAAGGVETLGAAMVQLLRAPEPELREQVRILNKLRDNQDIW